MAANDLTVFRNVGLDDAATSTDTSSVGEPSVAVSGLQTFLTGNWYASRSINGGQGWTHVDPFTSLPSAAGGFCCDQVVVHDRRRESVDLDPPVRPGERHERLPDRRIARPRLPERSLVLVGHLAGDAGRPLDKPLVRLPRRGADQ